MGYSPWSRKESDTTERLRTRTRLLVPEEGTASLVWHFC